jgi:PTS system nitrogen regulatory IIA component
MEVADILAERGVLYCTAVQSKSQLFSELAARAAELTGQPADAVLQAVESREELGSTGLGNGIAIPHGKLAGLKAVTALFARLETPIEFDAVDDQPVDIVVMLLAPAGAGADHLKALSRFARMLRTEHIVNDVRGMTEPAKIYALLTAPTATHYAA